jgi:hypothetical protein
MKQFVERYSDTNAMDDNWDIDFWQAQDPRLIFEAVNEMLKDYLLLRGCNADEFRFQRTDEHFHRGSTVSREDLMLSKEMSGRPQDLIDLANLKNCPPQDADL